MRANHQGYSLPMPEWELTPRLARLLTWCEGLLAAVGILALGFCFFALADASLYQNRDTQHALTDRHHTALTSGPGATDPAARRLPF